MFGVDLSEFLDSKLAERTLPFVGLVLLVALGYVVVEKMRKKLREEGQTASNHMTNFRELHERGELSDEEYRTIKATLAARMQAQLKEEQERSKRAAKP